MVVLSIHVPAKVNNRCWLFHQCWGRTLSVTLSQWYHYLSGTIISVVPLPQWYHYLSGTIISVVPLSQWYHYLSFFPWPMRALSFKHLHTLVLLFTHQVFFLVGRHIQLPWKREMGVHFLLHHRYHVEGVSHRVETENSRKYFETSPKRISEKAV